MERVNNPAKYLLHIVNNGEKYCIGFGVTELSDIAKKDKNLQDLIKGTIKSLIVTGKSGVLKENTNGKYVRKQPESKTSVWKHIEYFSYHWNREISYDREFNIWDKVMLHKFNLELTRDITPQGELILHFPFFTMKDSEEHYHMAGAAMNIAIQLGKYFMIYDSKFEPIIPVSKFKDKSILPSGTYGSVKQKLDAISVYLNDENDPKDLKGNSYRFALLKEFKPNDVTMGLGGFDEYLMFEYPEYDLMVLENLKSGNATYIFKLSKFDKSKSLNKQTARKDVSFKDRLVHENMEDWNSRMRKYFK